MNIQAVSHGLFISISQSGRAFGKKSIPGASSSALKLCDHFRASRHGADANNFELLLLDGDGHGTRSNVIARIVDFLDRLPHDCRSFIIYIIAHGKYRGGLTILTEDTLPPVFEDTGISLTWLYERIAQHTSKRRLSCLLVLDCCIENFRSVFTERMPKCVDLIIASSPTQPFTSTKHRTGSIFSSSLLRVLTDGARSAMVQDEVVSTLDAVNEVVRTSKSQPSYFSASGKNLGLPVRHPFAEGGLRSQFNLHFSSRELSYKQNSALLRMLQPTVNKVLNAYDMPSHMDEFGELLPSNSGRIELRIPVLTPLEIMYSLVNTIVFTSDDLFSEFEISDTSGMGVASAVAHNCFGLTSNPDEPTPYKIIKERDRSSVGVWIDENAFRSSCRKRTGDRPSGFTEFKTEVLSMLELICLLGEIKE